jgi:eukaryotic-like serine/threonine-protein kinase
MTLLARSLVSEKRLNEAAALLQEALAIQERAYGNVHPRVASALNELGRIAQQQGKLDDAEADFHRWPTFTARFTPASTIASGSHNQIWPTSM